MPSANPRDDRTRKVISSILRSGAAKNTGGQPSPVFVEAAQALQAIEGKHRLTLAERIELRNALARELVDLVEARAPALPLLPEKAPELWSEREGRKENPVAFIRRVYAPWLKRGLVRSDLRALDPPLYQALAVWMYRHPDDQFPELDSPLESIVRGLDDVMHAAVTAPRGRQRRAKLPHLRGK